MSHRNLLSAVVAGLVAGAVGAAAWAAIIYATGYELGMLAWLIGLVVGLAVQAGARGEAGAETGIAAMVVAVGAVGAGKFLAVHALLNQYLPDPTEWAISSIADEVVYEREQAGEVIDWPSADHSKDYSIADEYPDDVWEEAQRRWSALTALEREWLVDCPELANPDFVVSYLADHVAEEFIEAGRELNWPGEAALGEGIRRTDYPAEVWSEAAERWESMTPAERDDFTMEIVEFVAERDRQDRKSMIANAWKGTFGMLDIVFIGLAVMTAYKVGAGLTTDG